MTDPENPKMPLYEYTCEKCEHTFETLVSDGETVECPTCHGTQLQRLWSLPARPPAETAATPRCDPSAPPCGPACRRWPG